MRVGKQIHGGDDNSGDDTEFSPYAGERAAQVIQIDTSKHAAIMVICAVVCGFSVALAVFAFVTAYTASTEARLTQYFLTEPNLRTPEEVAAWNKFREENK